MHVTSPYAQDILHRPSVSGSQQNLDISHVRALAGPGETTRGLCDGKPARARVLWAKLEGRVRHDGGEDDGQQDRAFLMQIEGLNRHIVKPLDGEASLFLDFADGGLLRTLVTLDVTVHGFPRSRTAHARRALENERVPFAGSTSKHEDVDGGYAHRCLFAQST